MIIERGDIFLTNLEPIKGNEQGGTRPCLIIQNNQGNLYSPLTILAPITSKIFIREYPTNVFISKKESKLKKDSTVLLNQIRTIDKRRLMKKIGSLDIFTIGKVDIALRISLGIE
ncbi:MAG: type II toxin-antitoxin system PemK/MazF family toxin [Nanoarchaeota archaeon]|nr:type II toxin-antitoxin system PemK/MazF family toxin [Nanoarchaeota archaeon]